MFFCEMSLEMKFIIHFTYYFANVMRIILISLSHFKLKIPFHLKEIEKKIPLCILNVHKWIRYLSNVISCERKKKKKKKKRRKIDAILNKIDCELKTRGFHSDETNYLLTMEIYSFWGQLNSKAVLFLFFFLKCTHMMNLALFALSIG